MYVNLAIQIGLNLGNEDLIIFKMQQSVKI